MVKNNTKQFRDQYDDEDVLMVFRKHPVIMRRGLIYFMFAILLGVIPSLIKPELSYFYGGLAAGFILGILVAFPSWIHWYFSVYIVTNQRFIQITQKGLFKKSFSDIGIHHIQSVNYQIVGLQETLLGFGTIMIQTYLGDMIVHDVHHPGTTAKELSQILREHGAVLGPQEVNDEPQKVSHER